MDLNNNLIETQIALQPATATASSSPLHTSVQGRQEPAAGEDGEPIACPLRDQGNRRVHETGSCDSESQWSHSEKREPDASPSDAEQADLIAIDEMRDDIELIVDLYLLVENTRWLFRCLLW